jgi:hypothetical protein
VMPLRWVNVRSRFARRVALAGSRPPFVMVVHTVRGEYLPYLCRPETFWQMVASPSKGRFYNAYVRNILPRADVEAGGDDEDASVKAASALWSRVRGGLGA